MAKSTQKISDRVAATLACPEGKRTHLFPDKTGNGLCLSVSSSGRRFWKFRFDYGRRRNDLMTIGEFPLTGYEEAKVEAARLQRMVKVDKRDPRMVAYQPKTATTVTEAIDAWLTAFPNRNTATVKANVKPLKAKFGKTNLGDLTRFALKAWCEEEYAATEDRSNRGGACKGMLLNLNAVINWALREDTGIILPPDYKNPCRGLASRIDAIRDRIQTGHAVNWEDEQFRQILRAIEWTYERPRAKNGLANAMASNLCLVTGARPSEITTLRWDEIETVAGQPSIRRIVKDRHKTWLRTGRPRVITVGPRGIAILDRAQSLREATGYTGPWVFPSPQPARRGKPVRCINHFCRRLSTKVGFEVRPYNFRSAYINHSLEAAEGQGAAAFNATLQMVSENVGHTRPQITLAHYIKAKGSQMAESVLVTDAAFDRYDKAA